jgi:hypothetical protein
LPHLLALVSHSRHGWPWAQRSSRGAVCPCARISRPQDMLCAKRSGRALAYNLLIYLTNTTAHPSCPGLSGHAYDLRQVRRRDAAQPAQRGRVVTGRRSHRHPRNRRRSTDAQTPGGTPRGEGPALRDLSGSPVAAAGHAGERGTRSPYARQGEPLAASGGYRLRSRSSCPAVDPTEWSGPWGWPHAVGAVGSHGARALAAYYRT